MNHSDKFNSEVLDAFQKFLNRCDNISLKYEKCPYDLIRVMARKLLEVANEMELIYKEQIETIKTVSAINEANRLDVEDEEDKE